MAQTKIKQSQIVNDGWVEANETWTYASATTITVPSGAASKYQKGMPFKLTANSVELQGYIIGIADTVLTVVGDTLTNHTFTNNYYAHSGTVPIGFDEWFDWTPTYGGESLTYTSVTGTTKFRVSGLSCTVSIRVSGTVGGTARPYIGITPPVPVVLNSECGFQIVDSSTQVGIMATGSPIWCYKIGSNYSQTSGIILRGVITYGI